MSVFSRSSSASCPCVVLKHCGLLLVVLLLAFAASPISLYSQSATTGLVTGVVSDQTGAVVPSVQVVLQQQGTSSTLAATTDSDGRFVFPSVPPGAYSVRFSAKGFRSSIVSMLRVDVLQSITVNMTLEIGAATETVEVQASAAAELQTTDSSIGNVLGGEALDRLPAYTRSATSLMFLQPGVSAPAPPNDPSLTQDVAGGAMAGARSEQITFNLDGGDATSDLEGSNSYIGPPGEPQPAPIVPIPQESTEEFRVATSNPNATFGRSSGAQVALLTKHGTNGFHGSAYEYHFDSGFAANTWQNDRLGIHRPHQVDNRFGATTGGPILKDKLFFFVNYEGRRFHDSASVSRVVPTDTLRQGIIQFKDSTGAVVRYNFNPANGPIASLCGTTGAGTCDPRGIGVSSVSMAQIALLPHGNDTSIGDQLNYTGFTFNMPTPFREDIGVARFDYKISSKWNAFVTWHWARAVNTGTEQIQITGTPHSVSSDPFQPNLLTGQLTGQLTSNLTSVTHGSWLRNWWGWNRTAPVPLVSGTTAALQLDGEGTGVNTTSSSGKLISDPYNINTQQARARIWNGHDNYIAQDFSWIHGKNAFQFGGAGYIWHDYHLRTDDVLGGLTSGPIYYLESNIQSQGAYFNPGGAFSPPRCSTVILTNCLTSSSNSKRYDGLYAALMGIIDHSSQIQTRDGSFNPNSLGTPLFDQVTIPSYTTYFQNVWQARPGLTITYGIDWGVQLTPSEANGKEAVWTYANSGPVLNYYEYLQNRAAQLNAGVTTTVDPVSGKVTAVNAFNPAFSLVPVNSLATPFHGQMRHTQWTDFGPRISVAWEVPFHNRIFGNKATVIRGGYAKVYDRTSAVGEALNPLLTGGLADADQCAGPVFVAGGSFNCTGAATDPTNAYRLGTDGNGVGIPAPRGLPIPFTPNPTAFQPQHLSSSLDPFTTPGYAHSVDFTIQRALPGNMYLEIGYIGRFSRNLPQSLELNSPDYLMKDAKSGQTFTQAFNALTTEENAGTAITSQPFFENILGTPNCVAAGFSSCTSQMVKQDAAAGDISSGSLGHFAAFTFNPHLANYVDNMQIFEWSATSNRGWSNYNAGFININKSFSRGLQFQLNWTWSHAIGIQGINQQYLYSVDTPYNTALNKSSEPFDRKHTINAWWYYKLPFGTGGEYKTGSAVIDRTIGGWYSSGIFTYATGLPMWIGAFGDRGAWALGNGTVAVSSMGGLHGLESRHNTVNDSSCLGSGGASTTLPNLFADPCGVFASLSEPDTSVLGQNPYDQLRMVPSWNIDFSVGKNIVSTERYRMLFTADFLNAFNHVNFAEPALDIGGTKFGELTTQANFPRRILLGLKFEF